MAEVIITEFRAETGQFIASIDKAEQAVVGLDQAEKDAQKSTASLSQQLGSSAAKANVHKTAMGEVTKNTAKAAQETKKLGTEIKSTGAAAPILGKVGDAAKKTEADIGSATKAAGGFGTKVKDVASQATPAVGGIGGSFLNLLGPIGIVAGAIGGAFLAVFRNTDAGATAIEGLGRSVGFTFDRITGAVKSFAERLSEAFGGAEGPGGRFLTKLDEIQQAFTNVITLGASGAIREGLEGDLEAGNLIATQLDELANKQLTVNEATAKNEIVIRANLAALRDLSKPLEERLRLADEITTVENENLRIQREQLKEQLKVALFEAKTQQAAKGEVDPALKARVSSLRTDLFDLEAESLSLLERVSARRGNIIVAEENRKLAATAKTAAEQEKAAAQSLRAAEKRKTDKAKADADELKRTNDTIAAQKAVAELETAINTARLDEIGKRDAAVVASFEKQVEAARKAYTELATLAAPEDRTEIEQRQADAIIAINTALDEELARLREQDIEGVREYAKTKEEIQIEAVNAEFDAQKTATERIIAEGAERTEILKQIESNRQAALAEIRTEADMERLAQQEAANAAELNAIGGFANAAGALIAGMAQGQQDAAKEFAKASLSIALDAVDAMVPIWVAQATGASLVQPDSVATFGASGLARAAVLTALIKGVLAGLRGSLGFAQGGEVTLGSGPRVKRSNGDNVLATLQDREIVLSRASRARAESVFGRGVWGELGVPGFGGSIDWSSALARVGAASAARDGGRAVVAQRPNDDRRIIGAIGGIGSLREQRRQTELLEELARTRGRNPRARWA